MMKITDVLDIGRGVELEDKSVVQVLNCIGVVHSALERSSTIAEEQERLQKLSKYYVEIQRRVAVGLRGEGWIRTPRIGAK